MALSGAKQGSQKSRGVTHLLFLLLRAVQAIVTGLRTSVRAFQDGVKGVTPQDVLELMLVTQYYDMLREVRG